MSKPSPDVLTMDEEQLLFYSEIGRSITAWAHVEQALLWVASSCFKADDFQLHAAAFFSVENFRSKLQLADSVMRARFHQPSHSDDWRRIRDRLSTLAPARNRLAHYWVLGDLAGKPGRRMMLLPRRLPPNATMPKKPQKFVGALYAKDIMQYGYEFNATAHILENLAYRLRGLPERMPKQLEQVRRLPTLQEMTEHIRMYNVRPRRTAKA